MPPALDQIHPGIWISVTFIDVGKAPHIPFSLIIVSAVYMSPPPLVCMLLRLGLSLVHLTASPIVPNPVHHL